MSRRIAAIAFLVLAPIASCRMPDGGRIRFENIIDLSVPAGSMAALSPDGRYLAVQCTPQVFGEPAICLVDLETRDYKVLVEGGRLFRFTAGSGALFYLAGRGRAGDLFLVGLDGEARPLTSDGTVLPAP